MITKANQPSIKKKLHLNLIIELFVYFLATLIEDGQKLRLMISILIVLIKPKYDKF